MAYPELARKVAHGEMTLPEAVKQVTVPLLRLK